MDLYDHAGKIESACFQVSRLLEMGKFYNKI